MKRLIAKVIDPCGNSYKSLNDYNVVNFMILSTLKYNSGRFYIIEANDSVTCFNKMKSLVEKKCHGNLKWYGPNDEIIRYECKTLDCAPLSGSVETGFELGSHPRYMPVLYKNSSNTRYYFVQQLSCILRTCDPNAEKCGPSCNPDTECCSESCVPSQVQP